MKIHGGGKVLPVGSVALLHTPYAEVSTGDPHPALPTIKFTLCHVRFFANAQNDKFV